MAIATTRPQVSLTQACTDPALIRLSPHPGQLELLYLAERFRFIFGACGRRFGKTRFAAAVALWNLLLNPGADALVQAGETRYALIIANSREQSNVCLDHAKSLILASPLLRDELTDATEYELRFKGDRALLSMPCSSRSTRGYAASCVVFDEQAHYPDLDVTGPRTAERLWGALTPSVAQLGQYGRIIAISTPSGNSGLFADLFHKAQGGELPEAAAFTAPTSANPLVDEAYLAAQAAALGPDDYEREFDAIFTAGGAGFFELDRLRDATGDYQEVVPQDGIGWRAAIDPAFSKDPTGLVVVGRHRDDPQHLQVGWTQRWAPPRGTQLIRSRMSETEHIEHVVAEVAAVCAKFGIVRLISDQHLSGTMRSEFAKHGVSVRIAAWTQQSKTSGFRSLRALINTGRIDLPSDPQLLAELGRVRTKLGRDEIELPRTRHDHGDLASALAACVLDFELSTAGDVNVRTVSPFEQRKPKPLPAGMVRANNGAIPEEVALGSPELRRLYFRILNEVRNRAHLTGERLSDEDFDQAWRTAAQEEGLLP